MENDRKKSAIGLMIQLKKYGLNKLHANDRQGRKIILGHYDTLEIQPISKWFQFSPKVNAPNNEPLIVSRYPIKLLFPDDYEIEGFPTMNYSVWENPDNILTKHPCITVVLVKVTDGFRQDKRENLLKEFAELATHESNRNGIDLVKLHFAVFPSLGYSDFCILCAGDDWHSTLELIECLHNIKDANDIPVMSTDYMITAFHNSSMSNHQNQFDGIQLSVRVNLNPGCTARMLANVVPEGVEVFRTSGGSDCTLIANSVSANSKLVDFLLQEKSVAKNYIIDMSTSMQLRVNGSKGEESESVYIQNSFKNTCHLDETMQKFSVAILDYETMLKKHKRHTRQVNVMRELIASVKNIALQNHTQDITGILDNLFQHFSICIELCVEQIEKSNHDIVLFEEMEDEICAFCEYLTSFLADLSRSDCFFMERERYNHPSISSATSLLVAYNKWLNDFTSTVQKITLPDSRSEYSFLVTSGGCDQTRNFDAFHFLTPQLHGEDIFEQLPNIVQMSEMSLFDFAGTILRSFHECMHNCGKRLRKERVDYMIRFISTFYSKIIAKSLLQRERHIRYASTIMTSLFQEDHLHEQVAHEIKMKLNVNQSELEKQLIDSIESYLTNELLTRKVKDWNEVDYLSRNLREWLIVELSEIFTGYRLNFNSDGHESIHITNFAKYLYDSVQKIIKEYFDRCNKLCLEYGIFTKIFAFGLERAALIYTPTVDNYDRERVIDRTVSCVVQVVLSQLTMSGELAGRIAASFANENELLERFPYISLGESNVWDMLQACLDLFSESFADLASCKTLGAEFEDYILMHTFEDWDLAEAFDVESFSNKLRIPAIIQICFPECIEEKNGTLVLSENAKDRLEMAVKTFISHGMPSKRLELEDLYSRVNKMLDFWKVEEDLGSILMSYLQECEAIYQGSEVTKAFEKYKAAYDRIRLRKIDPMRSDYREKINQMVQTLTEWRNEDDDCNLKTERKT